MYDVVIIGGGPAGLTAGLYTARRNLRTLIVSKDLGGQAATTTVIENYPGTGPIDGYQLMEQFRDQAVSYGAEFILGETHKIERDGDGEFVVHYNETQVNTKSIILAFGLTPRSLNIAGERELSGKGVWYAAPAGLEAMRGKTAMVVGGGNSAIEAVNLLADVAEKVYLVHRRDRFRAEEVLLRKMEQHANVEKIVNAQLVGINPNAESTGVSSAVVEVMGAEMDQTVEVDGVFIHAGFMSSVKWLDGLVELSPKNEILITPECHTNEAGVFAAGDITTANHKQVVVSAGEGCKAALACYNYLMEQAGVEVKVDQDWQVTSGDHFIRT